MKDRAISGRHYVYAGDAVATPSGRSARARGNSISGERLDNIFRAVGQKLREGRSHEAEAMLVETISSYNHNFDRLADLKRLLSFTLETLGRYEESLEVVRPFEDESFLGPLEPATQIRVSTQLGVAYNNLTDQPKAVTILKSTLAKAVEGGHQRLLGGIYIALARVYRKLNECPIARDYAISALNQFREEGEWLGMAEAYREIALSHHQEGNSQRSLEFFELGIRIIGDRSAPFMLGKLYTDMSGAYYFLRKPKDGIACLEKSIGFFEQTEHVLNSVIAYNNLGINLVLVGHWDQAEEMIRRSLDLAIKANHVHMAGILESLGELKILRGEFEEAEALLTEAVDLARERKRQWYEAQALSSLARCYLGRGEHKLAAETARQTVELCKSIGDTHYSLTAELTLAESLLNAGAVDECSRNLAKIEEQDPSNDFFVLGNIQRLRGMAALAVGNAQLAVHHFNRSLTIFEAAEDVYQTAVVHELIGENMPPEPKRQPVRHLTDAAEIFTRLGLADRAAAIFEKIARIKDASARQETPSSLAATPDSAASQLLMVRLAEATASRELLFRELTAVLQQESRAKRIVIAEFNEGGLLQPFITHGLTGSESTDLTSKFNAAIRKGEEEKCAQLKSFAFFRLRTMNARPAYVLIQPADGAVLNDGTSLQPLLRVAELGMDVIALRSRENSTPLEPEANPYTSTSLMPGFIHSSPAMSSLVEEVYKIRSSDVTVLVTGESGTGKELVSRAIHTISNRKDKVFVPFNCTAVPKELAEGHLFGYRKGAFTGAVSDSPGMIRAADGGTLFLDEIGDLPLDVQPKLLRFLQEGEVQPVGEKRPIKVDVRVIAATNMPLEEKVADGTFREDLYYRLNVVRLRVPPLRERRSEIPPIINYYVNHYSTRFNKKNVVFTPQTVDLMMVCNWEGNVRQLCNEIQRIIARAVDGEIISPDHLSPDLKKVGRPVAPVEGSIRPIASFERTVPFEALEEGMRLETAVGELETRMIKGALSRHNWNISRVANELGLTRRGLYMKIERYGIRRSA